MHRPLVTLALLAVAVMSYYERYYCLFGGLGGNLMEDAVYFWLIKDLNGAVLNGKNNYIIRFEASQIPQTRAFWSLTLYTRDFFFAKNMPLNRHMLNSNSGLKIGTDGSLEIYLQGKNPGNGKETNWLPVPQDEYFTLLRVYWPEGDFLTGKWRMPDITEVKYR